MARKGFMLGSVGKDGGGPGRNKLDFAPVLLGGTEERQPVLWLLLGVGYADARGRGSEGGCVAREA